MYSFDNTFFKKIDTEEKAYVLGFFFADGYNSETQLEFSQIEQDEDILVKINNALKSDIPLYSYKNSSGNIKKVLRISSREMCKDISLLGGIKNKSLILQFPTCVPDSLIHHFIRGYFDGDGCIWNGKRKKSIVKDNKSKTGYRERIIHNVKFTFTGCIDLINSLQDLLVEKKVVKNKTKLNLSKAKDKENSRWCTMEYSGRGQIKNLFDFLYKDATIYGQRKYNKFQEIFCALDEKLSSELGLIAGMSETTISSQASSNTEDEGSSTIPEMEVESSDSKCPTLSE